MSNEKVMRKSRLTRTRRLSDSQLDIIGEQCGVTSDRDDTATGKGKVSVSSRETTNHH